MIKIAVFNLGGGMYVAFSLNQPYPIATVLRTPMTDKCAIEGIFISRFHSQRNEYKKHGIDIPRVERNGKMRGGWKFIWTPIDIFYNKPTKNEQVKTLVDEPGLHITRKTPFTEAMKKALDDESLAPEKPSKEQFVMAECNNGKFSFTPLNDDIIFLSQIPEYILKHNGDKDA